MPFLPSQIKGMMYFPHLYLKDGNKCSVQVGETLYCTPRDNKGPYTHVEVGYPTGKLPESWAEYGDGEGIDSEVFGYIPVALVQEYIELHGGIDISATINAWFGNLNIKNLYSRSEEE